MLLELDSILQGSSGRIELEALQITVVGLIVKVTSAEISAADATVVQKP